MYYDVGWINALLWINAQLKVAVNKVQLLAVSEYTTYVRTCICEHTYVVTTHIRMNIGQEEGKELFPGSSRFEYGCSSRQQ